MFKILSEVSCTLLYLPICENNGMFYYSVVFNCTILNYSIFRRDFFLSRDEILLICNMSVKILNSRRLLQEDIDKPCEDLANYLLGKILVRRLDSQTILKGRIVETEAYLGGDDKGSHSYNGRQEYYFL